MTFESGRGGPQGRILGLDAGERRIGVAISDPEQRIAVPLRTIERDRGGSELEAIGRLLRDEEVGTVVVGLPLSLSGEDSAQTKAARDFGESLRSRLGVEVEFWDERLSSSEAARVSAPPQKGRRERGKRPQTDIDAVAATIILQAYLDSRNRP